jgi:hypothetical protein
MTDTTNEFQDGEAAAPEDGAFDGDATTGATPSGIAPDGNEAMPAGESQPPVDGGVMGTVPENASVDPTGVTFNGDRDGELPPEEQGR